MAVETFKPGRQCTFYHSSADASTAKQIEVYEVGGVHHGKRMGLGPDASIAIESIVLSIAATGNAYIFTDIADVAITLAGVSTSADTITLLGDYRSILKAGDTFLIYGSTGNDGEWTIESVEFNEGSGTGGVGTTTITVTGNIADATTDGAVALRYFDIVAASTSADTVSIVGDYRGLFRVGRTFKIDGSTGNDNSGTAYTVTSVSYSVTTGQTTIGVASSPGIASAVADGYVIPQTSAMSGSYLWQGDPADDTQVGISLPYEIELPEGFGLFVLAAAGSIDVTGTGWYRRRNNE